MTMRLLSKSASLLLVTSGARSFTPFVRTLSSQSRLMSSLGSSDAKYDYANHIESLAHLLDETREEMAHIKRLAQELKELELADPNLSDLGSGKEADNLRKALAEAKAAVDTFGPNSEEAKQAWVELEMASEFHEATEPSHPSYRYSAAALKAHHVYNSAVDTELLDASINAIDTIDALGHFVQVEKNRLEEQPWLTS